MGTTKPSYDMLPPATLEAASRHISLLYQNVIFSDDGQNECADGEGGEGLNGDATAITWPPTQASGHDDDLDVLSILHQTQNDTSGFSTSQSFNYSDTSSIIHFPTFRIDLHALTSLSAILSVRYKSPAGRDKVDVLLAALEVTLDTITLKKGPDAGKQVSMLKMILGDEDGCVCKLTAWRELADLWGGTDLMQGAKRGDILLLENVSYAISDSRTPILTASPFLKSRLTICYRAMPYTKEDNRLRPDLRLAVSDAGLTKLAELVRWFERMAGLRPA